MVDVNKLKGKIVEKGYTISTLAQIIGIEKSTFYRRISDSGRSFTIGEVDSIAKCLDLTETEATAIFFNSPVA